MKFSTHHGMDAPIAAVFDMLASFDHLEEVALQRGAKVLRRDQGDTVGLGTTWRAQLVIRGQNRDLDIEITEFSPPNRMTLKLSSQGMDGETSVDLTALSEKNTRIDVAVSVRATTLKTRILLHSLKLTKPELDRRFDDRVARYLGDLSSRDGRHR